MTKIKSFILSLIFFTSLQSWSMNSYSALEIYHKEMVSKANANLEDSVFSGLAYYLLDDKPLSEEDDFANIQNNFLYRWIEVADVEETTLSPGGVALLLKHFDIGDTSIVFVRYPVLPFEAAQRLRSINQVLTYLSTEGGEFGGLKSILKNKLESERNFNIIIILPDGHLTLLLRRVAEDDKNLLFCIDSVGKLMRFKVALCQTINSAVKDAHLAEHSFVMFGDYPRQGDIFSCPLYVTNDLINISRFPQILDKIRNSIHGGDLVSVAQTTDLRTCPNTYAELPIQLLKCCQNFTVNLKSDRGHEVFDDSPELTMAEFLKNNEIGEISPYFSPKIGEFWQTLELTTTLFNEYYEILSERMNGLSESDFKAIFTTYFVDPDKK